MSNEVFPTSLSEIILLSPQQFERWVANLFFKRGFEVKVTAESGDGGVDVQAISYDSIFAGLYVVQCKRYTVSHRVPVSQVRDLYGVVHASNAIKGIFITTSLFTRDCYGFARGNRIELIDGPLLQRMAEHAAALRSEDKLPYPTETRPLFSFSQEYQWQEDAGRPEMALSVAAYDAVRKLLFLGFRERQVMEVVTELASEEPQDPAETLIRKALAKVR